MCYHYVNISYPSTIIAAMCVRRTKINICSIPDIGASVLCVVDLIIMMYGACILWLLTVWPFTFFAVTLSGSQSFRGLLVQARTVADDTPVGSFTAESGVTRLSSCDRPDVCMLTAMTLSSHLHYSIISSSLPLLTQVEVTRQVLTCHSQLRQQALDPFVLGVSYQLTTYVFFSYIMPPKRQKTLPITWRFI